MNINKHRVFISYYHSDDQYYKDELIRWNYWFGLFEDWSVNDGDIDDTYMNDEDIRIKIRDEYIKDATVLILLCGTNTKYRKFIDWELHAAMYDTEKNPKMGIVVINLPGCRNGVRAIEEREKQIVANGSNWTYVDSRSEFMERYPDAPERIIDCLANKHSQITFVDWHTISNNHSLLTELIDFAYQRRKTMEYDFSRPLRRRNSN